MVDVERLPGGPIAGIGVDAGSTTCKAVAVDASGAIVAWCLEPMSPRVEEQTAYLLAAIRSADPAGSAHPTDPAGSAHPADPAGSAHPTGPGGGTIAAGAAPVHATGYGRKLVPGAERAVTEITAHARGVYAELRTTGTLFDIGGQDSKVIRIGPGGVPADFAMNDKCAAGTGRFLEHTAARLGVGLDEIGPQALAAREAAPITSTCTVFAESEIVSLVARGRAVDEILLGLHTALVSRILTMVRTVGITPPLVLSGGVARNVAVVELLGRLSGEPVRAAKRPQLMGAYGAALIAAGPKPGPR